MPTQRKGPRLWLRKGRKGSDGAQRQAAWIIIDGRKHVATGCAAGEIEDAEQSLTAYLATKHKPKRKEQDIEAVDVADVLSIYVDDCAADLAGDADKFRKRIERLTLFWGGKALADVTGETCREYVRERGNKGGARRDLEDLRAAVNYHAKEGFHRGVVSVWLPERGAARTRWLTRSEAARLVWACWRAREVQTWGKREIQTEKRPLRHLARFILIGLYTGTRAGAIASASPHRGEGRSYVDLDAGRFYRLAEGKRETNKRQPTSPVPGRLLPHLRRWARLGGEHFVEWNGQPVKSVKTGFATAVRLADLPGQISPHTLRHTAATWLMLNGVDKWEAAGFLGMSVQMLDRVYGHHHPDHQQEAARRIGFRRQPGHRLVERLDEARLRKAKEA